jgi:hypothetical protein
MKGALMSILNVHPLEMCSSGFKVAKTKFMQDVIAGDLPMFEKAAAPSFLSAAHLKFLPLENLLTGMTHRVFSRVNTFIENWSDSDGELTDNNVRKKIFDELQDEFQYTDDAGFDKVMETAFCGFKVGTLWNPMRCTFTRAIVFKNGKPLAVMVVDIESTTTQVDAVGLIIYKYLLPIPLVTKYVSNAGPDAVTGTANSFLNFFSNGVNKISGAIGAICQSATQPSNVVAIDTVTVNRQCDAAATLAEALNRANSAASGGPADVAAIGGPAVIAASGGLPDVAASGGLPVVAASGGPADVAASGSSAILSNEQLRQVNEMCDVLQQQIPVEFTVAGMEAREELLRDFILENRIAKLSEETEASKTLEAGGAAVVRPALLDNDPSSKRQRKGGKSRTRRRRSSSSTRSSTTRGRKATTRRNQSKKHKQSSRRRRSSRKSSRKN